MPNFNVHWLVALQAVKSAPRWVRAGCDRYLADARDYSTQLGKVIVGATDDTTEDALRQSFRDKHAQWKNKLREPPSSAVLGDHDDATCFSAYMLGACGPDFWTLPSPSAWGVVPDTASRHFDLGHYNRTHRQFQVSVFKLARSNDLAARLEKAYFLGMATHVGTDLVMHQLVNVYAGAYNLLKKKWENEQFGNALGLNLWSTHNKVEHYWDTYVRYRYLGDHGPVFTGKSGPRDDTPWVSPTNLATVEGLLRYAKEQKKGRALKRVESVLGEAELKYLVEQPLAFPWLVSDRICAPGDLQPFIWRRVVRKPAANDPDPHAAYPPDDVHPLVAGEATGFQMQDGAGHSERKKLAFFTTTRNGGTAGIPVNTSNNYLTYIICPDLAKVRESGNGAFYELEAVRKFMERAAQLASTFALELAGAYDAAADRKHPAPTSPDDVRLDKLGRFWNLDTGLGVQVRKVRSHTAKEVVSQLDFVHAFEVAGAQGPIGYPRRESEAGYLKKRTEKQFEYPADRQAFKTYADGRAPAVLPRRVVDVSEREDAFLDQVRLAGGPLDVTTPVKIGSFFAKAAGAAAPAVRIRTRDAARRQQEHLAAGKIFERLNLCVRIPIEGLGDQTALIFYADTALGLEAAVQDLPASRGTEQVDAATHGWLTKRLGAGVLDLRSEPDPAAAARLPAASGLRAFSTRLLANLRWEKAEPKRKTGPPDGWNGVVPYGAHQGHYGRNFAIGTGRSSVLKQKDTGGSGNFWPTWDFEKWSNVSPTEQVFFTLYPLVKTKDGVFDVFRREEVKDTDLARLKKIEAVGFVKIVLFYVLGADGAAQLDTCYVDGLEVPVTPIG